MDSSNVVPLLTGPALVKLLETTNRGRLLDEPAMAFVLWAHFQGQAREDLQRALRPFPEATLRHLLDPVGSQAPQPLQEFARSKVLAAILQTAKKFVDEQVPNPESVQERAKVLAPPQSLTAFGDWAHATGVTQALTVPARKLLEGWVPHPILSRTSQLTSLGELATGSRPPLLEEQDADFLSRWARVFLHGLALTVVEPVRPAMKLSDLQGIPLAHPGLEPFRAVVTDSLQRLDAKHPGPPRGPEHQELRLLEGDEPRLHWTGRYGNTDVQVGVGLQGWRTGRLEPHCYNDYRCDHGRPALLRVLSFLHAKPQPAHETLLKLLNRPTWWRALAVLEDAAKKADKVDAKEATPKLITWRLHHLSGEYVLRPTLHVQGKRMEWSKGKVVSVAELTDQRDCFDFPNADQVLALLATDYDTDGERTIKALLLLAGYPHLFFADSDQPLTVRRGELSVGLSVRAQANGPSGRAQTAIVVEHVVDGAPAVVKTDYPGVRPGAKGVRYSACGRYLVGFDGGECVVVELTAAQELLLDALDQIEGHAPEALPDLAPYLAAIERHLPLKLPPELEGERVEPDLRHLLRLTPQADGALSLELLVRPLGEGPVRPPGEEPRRLCGEVAGRRVHAIRDLDGERSRAAALSADLRLPEHDEGVGSSHRRLLRGDAALDLLSAVESRTDVVVEWPKQAVPVRIAGRAQASSLKVKLESKRDWFGLEGSVEVGEEKIALSALMDAVRRGSRYVELAPGRYAQMAEELRERLQRASEVVFHGKGGLEVSFAASEAVSDLLDAAGETRACVEWQGLVERMKAARTYEPPLPAGLKADLRPYQIAGYRWLMRMAHWGVGACLADDMGLGKTVQALAALLSRKDTGPALVVAPTSVGFNWLRECERFAPGLRPKVFREGDRAATLAALEPGDLPGVQLRPAPQARREPEGGALRHAGAGRGAGHQELGDQAGARRAGSGRAVAAGVDRHADGEPPGRAVEPLAGADARPARQLGAVPRALRHAHRAPQGSGAARGPGPGGAAVPVAARQGAGGAGAAAADRAQARGPALGGRAQALRGGAPGGGRGAVGNGRGRVGGRALPGAGGADPAAPAGLPPAAAGPGLEGAVEQVGGAGRAGRGAQGGGAPGAGLQPVHRAPGAGEGGAGGGGGQAALPRRADPGARAGQAGGRVPARRGRGLPHLAQGRRDRAQPHRRRLRHPPGPVVEPRGRGPGERPGAPHRPDQARDRLSAGGYRDHRGGDPRAARGEAGPGLRRAGRDGRGGEAVERGASWRSSARAKVRPR
ncbi:MAG: SNF2-related protein [Myxococcales bacterium]